MATTTNFGWETPDDTDLVKDGALAIRTLGSAIDTSLVDLKGGTTGQVLSKTSNTDMDFTWINNDQGDITAVNAGTGLTGGGTSGAVTLTNDMATTITASGDIVVGTGSGTYDNLPIGTTGQILTADTTVSPYKVKWADPAGGGGFTLLSTTTLTGANSFSFTGISSSYTHLLVVLNGVAVATAGTSLRIDTVDTTTFLGNRINSNDSTVSSNSTLTNTQFIIADDLQESGYSGPELLNGYIWFYGYNNNPIPWDSTFTVGRNAYYQYKSSGAFTSSWNGFKLNLATGNFNGGTARLYGVK